MSASTSDRPHSISQPTSPAATPPLSSSASASAPMDTAAVNANSTTNGSNPNASSSTTNGVAAQQQQPSAAVASTSSSAPASSNGGPALVVLASKTINGSVHHSISAAAPPPLKTPATAVSVVLQPIKSTSHPHMQQLIQQQHLLNGASSSNGQQHVYHQQPITVNPVAMPSAINSTTNNSSSVIIQTNSSHPQPSVMSTHKLLTNAATGGTALIKTASMLPASSKLLVLHPKQLNDTYITSDATAVGNIVVLATEPMDFISAGTASASQTAARSTNASSNHITTTTASPATPAPPSPPSPTTSKPATTDEELTPLHWLHDKNLLRGINLPASAAAATTGHKSLTIVSSPSSTTISSPSTAVVSPLQHSPTSDYHDDSFVSSDEPHNVSSSSGSSARSSVAATLEQSGVSIYPSSPAATTSALLLSNNVLTISSASSPSSVSAGKHNPSSSPLTTAPLRSYSSPAQIIQLTPSSRTTVIEYKTANLHPKPLTSAVGPSSLVIATGSASTTTSSPAATSSPANGTASSSSSIMHYHKKYLREEHQRAIQKNGTAAAAAASAAAAAHPSPFHTDVECHPAQIIVQQQSSSPPSTPSAVAHPAASAVFHQSHSTVDTHPSNTTVTRLDLSPATSPVQPPSSHASALLAHQQLLTISTSSSVSSSPPSPSAIHHHLQHHQHMHAHGHQHHQIIHPHHMLQNPNLMDIIDYAPEATDGSRPCSPIVHSRRESMSSPDSFMSPSASPPATPSKHGHPLMSNAHHLHQVLMQQQQSPGAGSPPAPVAASAAAAAKTKYASSQPYDPLVHTNNKPPLSFSSLIFLAIEDSHEKALPVKEIYAWIVAHYPYFKSAPTGWKNSVRHNLSLNKCFQKVEKAPNMGKGSLWRVEQQYKQNLVQALTRSAYHSNATVGGAGPASPVPDSPEHSGAGKQQAASAAKLSPRAAAAEQASSQPNAPPPPAAAFGKSNAVSSASAAGGRPVDAELFPRLSKYMSEIVSPVGAHRHRRSSSPTGETSFYDAFGNATTITNNHNNNTIVINNNGGPSAGCFTNSGSAVFYNGSAERLVRDWGADSIDDVNAATAMLALKHGPKVFAADGMFAVAAAAAAAAAAANAAANGISPVITSSPSEDHTYSTGAGLLQEAPNAPSATKCAAGSPPGGKRSSAHFGKQPFASPATGASDNTSIGGASSSDAAYESSEECSHTPVAPPVRRMRLSVPLHSSPVGRHSFAADDLEARRKHAEGVDALLTFANEVSSLSSSSSSPLKHQRSFPRSETASPPHHDDDADHQRSSSFRMHHLHRPQPFVYGTSGDQPHAIIYGNTPSTAASVAAAMRRSSAPQSPESSEPRSPVGFQPAHHQHPVGSSTPVLPHHSFLHSPFQTLNAAAAAVAYHPHLDGVGLLSPADGVPLERATDVGSPTQRKVRARTMRTKLKKRTAWVR